MLLLGSAMLLGNDCRALNNALNRSSSFSMLHWMPPSSDELF